MKYPTAVDGQWIKPKRKYYMMACCDCGLVHKMEFRILPYKNGKTLVFRAWRDKERTARRRKRYNIKVKTK